MPMNVRTSVEGLRTGCVTLVMQRIDVHTAVLSPLRVTIQHVIQQVAAVVIDNIARSVVEEQVEEVRERLGRLGVGHQ